MPTCALGTCVDRRFLEKYYHTAGLYLGGTIVPEPGADFPDDSAFAHFWLEKYGLLPFIIFPHDLKCIAWADRGGDYAGFQHSYKVANVMHSHGLPTACLKARAGQKPEYLYNGLSDRGCDWLHQLILSMLADETLDWSISPHAKAKSVVFGHDFFERPWIDVALYFSSRCIQPTSIPLVGGIINHFADPDPEVSRTPGFFSKELSEKRQQEIAAACAALPVYFPQLDGYTSR